MTTRLILNPAAGAGRSERRLRAAWPVLQRAFGPLELRESDGAGQVAQLAREAVARGDERLFVAGGDGTVHHAARALAGSRTALGILPVGTGNDVARAVGLPADPAGAARVLSQGRTRPFDLGLVCLGDARRTFCCTLGLGFDDVALARIDGASGLRRGRLLYALAAAGAIWSYPGDEVGLHLEAGPAVDGWSGASMLVTIANTPTYAGGFRVAPAAQVADGLLDLAVFPRASKAVMFARLARVALGAATPDVVRAQSARIEVSVERALPLTLDGERTPLRVRPDLPLVVTSLPGALAVLGAPPLARAA
jgi:diacylglycerol kinase (ATP)